ncbi:MAG TPA: hypothetical protein VF817_00970 [Patescibacteria group bacterium]
MTMTKTRKVATLASIAGGVYIAFEGYIVMLGIFFPLKWGLPLLYVGMVLINSAGLLAIDSIGEELLAEFEEGKKWIQADDSKHEAIKRILRDSKWIAFVALSVFVCSLSAYLYIRESSRDSFAKAVVLISLGSIPCALVWGGGMRFVWLYKWYVLPVALLMFFARKMLKKTRISV